MTGNSLFCFLYYEYAMQKDEYRELLNRRAKESRVYSQHQFVGVTLAEMLDDKAHTSLYIRLAKNHNQELLLHLARTVSGNKEVRNKGAYFMRLLQESRKDRS
ncbi:MAG: hypothetical protein A3F24_00525 [Candidatus Colwellbacteria bacterium RIFCSPHIGHO2_12_FULL_44_17]|uniref:Uncharacterized protein n=2 Tax=Candidatus Colwelliibacteriota TaxID=1817904 RepID=A0A1G1Z6G4_9BACT|nr:MAG: hypothetical protein A3F24_00525 [Candidatus Colwellbacteria bacterium RIFCSPHIGHO2_12_FULL_44_17]